MKFQRAVDRSLRPLRLTHTQYWVLACTHELVEVSGDAVSQQRIAEAARLDKMTVSFVVRRLEAKGLLDRDVSASGPALRVIVTAKGHRALSEAALLIAPVAGR